ncbi:hypothetical protein Cni_G21750 [Canna indica]|uniref:Uncharacterized protein n=1 Tax=Canna indica TaxID=4628 RepID=A0AAQ3QHL9_9LILI|nr:hypothetical protein Cni_G21750 [Canna indica]
MRLLLTTLLPMFRWPELGLSSLTGSLRRRFIFRWQPEFNFFSGWQPRGPVGLSFSADVVDDVVWAFVAAFESVVLVSMLCFFYVFCGCTI